MTNFGAAITAFLLGAFFYFAAMYSEIYGLLILTALFLIIAAIAGLRSATTQTCSACKSTIPKGAAICRACRTQVS